MEESGYYYIGVWIAEEGKELAVENTWKKHMEKAIGSYGARKFSLLQDPVNTKRLFSYSLWESESAMRSWIKTTEFKEFVAGMTEVCEYLQIIVLRPLVHLAAGPPAPVV